ncbi:MAG: hypothetical protein NVSMB63_12990 [Sediminibacterium sp.]
MIPFKNILIPVDSLVQAHVAVEKALELYEPAHTTLHLVCTDQQENNLNPLQLFKNIVTYITNRTNLYQSAADKLAILTRQIASQYPDCPVKNSIGQEYLNAASLTRHIAQEDIDLVIIAKKKERPYFFPRCESISVELAKKSNIPILTVTPGCLNHPIKSILLPVNTTVPERRIQVALAFAREYNAHIHLVTLLDNNTVETKARIDAFYHTYKILSEYGHSPQYKILQGADSAEILLRYAYLIKADMIMVSEEKKSSFFGLMHHKITDLLHPLSALHVLTLKPYRP